MDANKVYVLDLYKTKTGKAVAANEADIEIELSLNSQAYIDTLNLMN